MVSLPPLSRDVARAVRTHADRQSERIAAQANGPIYFATVDSVTAGGGADGISSAVTLSWRGSTGVPAKYGSTYTPRVGDWVFFAYHRNQPVIIDRIVG